MGLILPLYGGVSTANAIILAVLSALASFLTADLVIYPRYGNLPAMLTDVIISGIILVESSYVLAISIPVQTYAIVLALLAGGEWYFHRYLGKAMFKGKRR